ncbi:putative Bet v I/Major latex protein [Helianthus annuus]|nr:putative Bet v I/Major latex protein [Helianthus annuus]KAJ0867240.1 putative Bet v I/Major latex protein [Helianthus annuus]
MIHTPNNSHPLPIELKEKMALSGKRVAQIEIKPKGDVFHKLWKANPHHIPNLSPTLVQNCQLHEGEIGTVGCVLHWNYFYEGKDCVAKTRILAIDDEKKLTTYQVVEGDFLKLYKNIYMYCHVDTKGPNHVVTWTFEYEKLRPDVPDPDALLDFYKRLTKDIETKHL